MLLFIFAIISAHFKQPQQLKTYRLLAANQAGIANGSDFLAKCGAS